MEDQSQIVNQVAQTLRLGNQTYVNNLNIAGGEARLNDQNTFQQNLAQSIFGDKLSVLQQSLGDQSILNVNQQKFSEAIDNMDNSMAEQIMNQAIQGQQTANMYGNIANVLKAGGGAAVASSGGEDTSSPVGDSNYTFQGTQSGPVSEGYATGTQSGNQQWNGNGQNMADLSNGASPQLQALQQLQGQLPVANQQLATQQAAGRAIQLQQAAKAAPVGTSATGTAQAMGATQATQAGAQDVQNLQGALAQANQLGGQGLAAQATTNQGIIGSEQLGLGAQQQASITKLANVNQEAKQQLYDAQMQFQKDQQGRTIFNQAQLADYAVTTAQNQQQYQNYVQTANDLTQKNLQAMQQAYNITSEQLNNQYQTAKQQGDQAAMTQIAQQNNAAQQAMTAAKNAAANTQAMWSAGTGLLASAGMVAALA